MDFFLASMALSRNCNPKPGTLWLLTAIIKFGNLIYIDINNLHEVIVSDVVLFLQFYSLESELIISFDFWRAHTRIQSVWSNVYEAVQTLQKTTF